MGALHLSNMYNKIRKYEVLKEVNMNDLAIINKQKKEIRDILLNTKLNGKKIFTAVE